MALTQQTFLGASICSFDTAIGWNDQVGQLTVTLVEDPQHGDVFIQPYTGQFVFFSYDSFTFGGIVQSFKQIFNVSSFPTYEVIVSDPREILAGVQLIIGEYTGPVQGVPNLINIYGYMEATGFGNSQINEAGMPLGVINRGLQDLVTSPGNAFNKNNIFANPVTFKGQRFGIDLQQVPLLDTQYRIAGPSISVLDLVAQVCQDSSCDFFVRLIYSDIGPTIRIETVARSIAPPLTSIALFLDNQPEAVAKERGQELRNDVTSTFLVGGNLQILEQVYQQWVGPSGIGDTTPETANIWPFWGFDKLGNAMIGKNYYQKKLTRNKYQSPTIALDRKFDGRWWNARTNKWQDVNLVNNDYQLIYQPDNSICPTFYAYKNLQGQALQSDKITPATRAADVAVYYPNGDKNEYFPMKNSSSLNFDSTEVIHDTDQVYSQGRGIPDDHGIFIDIEPFDSNEAFPNLVDNLNELNNDSIKEYFVSEEAQYGHEYFLSCREMRSAIVGQDVWTSYNDNFPLTERGRIFGMVGTYSNNEFLTLLGDVATNAANALADGANRGAQIGDVFNQKNIINSFKKESARMDQNLERITAALEDVYSYVDMYAQKFYGIKFMVRIPYDVVGTRDNETGAFVTNIEVCDGGYLPEGSEPLGLPPYLEDIFTNDQGLFQSFATFYNATGLVYTHLNRSDYAITPDSSVLYVKCTAEPGFVFSDWQAANDPRAVINLAGPVYSKPNVDAILEPYFGHYIKAVESQLSTNGFDNPDITLPLNSEAKAAIYESFRQTMLSPSTTNFFAGMSTQAVMPDAIAVPLKDNTNTYGPWYSVGADGKSRFEHDESLTPWNYAGFDGMNAAATAKIAESFSFMQATEMGTITIPGSPALGVGNALIANGPIITNVNVRIGTDGVTTTYTMRSYTPKYGLLARNNADKFNNINRSLYQQRRLIKQLYRDATSPVPFSIWKTAEEKSLFSDFRGRRDVRASLSPHEMLYMQSINNMQYRDLSVDVYSDPSGDFKLFKGAFDTFNNVTSYFSADPEKGDYNDFTKVAVTLDQLFIPFVPGPVFDSLSSGQQKFFPRPYQSTISGTPVNNWPYMFDATITGTMDIISSGTYGQNSISTVPQYSWLKPTSQYGSGMVALRSPVFIAGPGYTTAGVLANGNPSGLDLQKPANWVVGPLNLQWDETTHSWFSVSKPQPTLIIGRVLGLAIDYMSTAQIRLSENVYGADIGSTITRAGLGTAYVALVDNLRQNQSDYSSNYVSTKLVFYNPFNEPIVQGNIIGLEITQNGYAVLTKTLRQTRDVVCGMTAVNNSLVVTTMPISVAPCDNQINYAKVYENIDVAYNDIAFLNHGLISETASRQTSQTPVWNSGTNPYRY